VDGAIVPDGIVQRAGGFETNRPELVERARKCAAFFLGGSHTGTKGLHYNRYFLGKRKWLGEEYFPEDRFSSRRSARPSGISPS